MQPKLRITGPLEETNNKQGTLNKCVTPTCADFYKGKTEVASRVCSDRAERGRLSGRQA